MATVFKTRSVGMSTLIVFPLPIALEMWSRWTIDVPPVSATGDADTDRRLADAFRALIALPDAAARLAWLERAVFSSDDFVPAPRHADCPPAAKHSSRYREVLIRWWLDIFDETGR